MKAYEHNVYASFLRKVFFFKNLGDDDIAALAAVSQEERFGIGEVIFTEETPADKFYILMDGIVEVWKSYDQEERSLLATHEPGHFFGEMALIDQLPRSATLVARVPSRTLCISHDDFQNLIGSHISIALSVMRSISLMVRNSNESFVEDLHVRNLQLQRANEELKLAQEELLRNIRLTTIGKFSSLILHDIRNPLGVMKALCELTLLHQNEPQLLVSDIERMKAELFRLERLASDFLDYSRGEIRLSIGLSSVEHLFKRLYDTFYERMNKDGIGLKLIDKVKRPIVLDEDRFARVLLNLVDNARKAAPSGSQVEVTAESEERKILFTIKDSGEGMSDSILAEVYEPFFSASSKGGTGLGMLIVKNIVEAHEGSIDIHSVPGKGTVVSVAIPSPI